MKELTDNEKQLIKVINKYRRNVFVFLRGDATDDETMNAQKELEILLEEVIVLKG